MHKTSLKCGVVTTTVDYRAILRRAGMGPAAPHDAEAPDATDAAACTVDDAVDQPLPCEADPPRLARMAAFLAVLICGYVAAHGAATHGLPSDGRRHFQAGDIGGARPVPLLYRVQSTDEVHFRCASADVGRLLECGVVLGWLLRVDEAHRFRYLQRHAWWMLALFFGVGPCWSAFNAIPALQVSLADLSAWRAPAWVALGVGAALVAALLCWHAMHAWRTLPQRAFAAYLASRAAPFIYYGIAVGAARAAFNAGADLREPHLHHAALALGIAAFGRFNSPASAAVLAVAAGIFVQGVGAYGFDPLMQEAGCKNLALPSFTAAGIAASAGCRWDNALVGPTVRLRVCPGDIASLKESLYMRCRKGGASG